LFDLKQVKEMALMTEMHATRKIIKLGQKIFLPFRKFSGSQAPIWGRIKITSVSREVVFEPVSPPT